MRRTPGTGPCCKTPLGLCGTETPLVSQPAVPLRETKIGPILTALFTLCSHPRTPIIGDRQSFDKRHHTFQDQPEYLSQNRGLFRVGCLPDRGASLRVLGKRHSLRCQHLVLGLDHSCIREIQFLKGHPRFCRNDDKKSSSTANQSMTFE